MAAAAVVEALDVFEDRVGELEAGVPALPVEQFGLHAAPERLDDGVVPRRQMLLIPMFGSGLSVLLILSIRGMVGSSC